MTHRVSGAQSRLNKGGEWIRKWGIKGTGKLGKAFSRAHLSHDVKHTDLVVGTDFQLEEIGHMKPLIWEKKPWIIVAKAE